MSKTYRKGTAERTKRRIVKYWGSTDNFFQDEYNARASTYWVRKLNGCDTHHGVSYVRDCFCGDAYKGAGWKERATGNLRRHFKNMEHRGIRRAGKTLIRKELLDFCDE